MSWMVDRLQPGDLIEISRPVCQHWAIYVGNEQVVHLVPETSGFSASSGSDLGSSIPSSSSMVSGSGISSTGSVLDCYAVVKLEPLKKVVMGTKFQINNKYDTRYTPYPVDKIISNAMAEVGKRIRYSVIGYNCEHFVTKLRYGIPDSDQVTKGLAVASDVANTVVSSSPLLAIGAAICAPVIAATAFTASLLRRFW